MTATAPAMGETMTEIDIDPLVTEAIRHLDDSVAEDNPRRRRQEASQCLAVLGTAYEKLLHQAKSRHIYSGAVAHALQAFDAILLESTAKVATWLDSPELLRNRLQRGIDAAIEADSQVWTAAHAVCGTQGN